MKDIVVNANFLTMPMVGTSRMAIEICRELIAKGVKLTFVAPQKIQHEEIAREFNVKKIGWSSGIFWEQIELPFYLMFQKKCVLICFTNTAPLLRSNNIIAILDLIPLVNPKWACKRDYLNFLLLVPLIAKRCLKIFTVSECSKKDIVKYLKIKPQKIDVIYCGVKVFKKVSSSSSSSEKNELIKGKYILAVSHLEPRKNFINVVRAFNLLSDMDLSLVLVGPDFTPRHMTELAPIINYKKTIIKGYVNDEELTHLYQNAFAFIYPSLYEGFGLPPLEAMQYGCPVITSNLSSIPEICGDAVLYADPYSIEDIANKIKSLDSEPKVRDDLRLKGFGKIKDYTWARSAELLTQCINSTKPFKDKPIICKK